MVEGIGHRQRPIASWDGEPGRDDFGDWVSSRGSRSGGKTGCDFSRPAIKIGVSFLSGFFLQLVMTSSLARIWVNEPEILRLQRSSVANDSIMALIGARLHRSSECGSAEKSSAV